MSQASAYAVQSNSQAKVAPTKTNEHGSRFSALAQETARWAGKPATFTIAVAFILLWAVTGPMFGYSDTWQLVVNTATTIVTFLMVFLIQNTQNRDTMALQIKLADLIIAVKGAHNKLATAEDLCEEDLEALHEEYRKRADETLDTLNRKRGTDGKRGESGDGAEP